MKNKPVGHSYTAYATPMHVAHLTLLMLRATFAEIGGEQYAYRFHNDFNETGIIIDTSFTKESGAYGRKPALVVSRGQVSAQQIAMGDRGAQSLHTQNAVKTSLVQSSLEIRVISKSSMEVDILSNEVFNFLTTCRTIFPEMLGLQQVTNPVLSPISPMEQDDSMYVCVAGMSFLMQYKWRHIVPQNILESLHLYVNDRLKYVFEPDEQ